MKTPKSFLSWVGGKSRLTNQLLPLLPEHHCYCEVFAGAAWMLFRKEPSEVEIVNDINSDLTNLYRVVKLHLEELVKALKWLLIARDEFDRHMQQDPSTLTDIQRAARFFYIMKTGYGARVRSPSFGIASSRPSNFSLLRLEDELSDAHYRLHRVFIENKPYAEVIGRFDKPDTFFYMDPPYWGCESDYGKGLFNSGDFTTLRDQLAGIKGQFLMSINDVPDVRELFNAFVIKEVTTRYTMGDADHGKPVTELLIMNYEPPKA